MGKRRRLTSAASLFALVAALLALFGGLAHGEPADVVAWSAAATPAPARVLPKPTEPDADTKDDGTYRDVDQVEAPKPTPTPQPQPTPEWAWRQLDGYPGFWAWQYPDGRGGWMYQKGSVRWSDPGPQATYSQPAAGAGRYISVPSCGPNGCPKPP